MLRTNQYQRALCLMSSDELLRLCNNIEKVNVILSLIQPRDLVYTELLTWFSDCKEWNSHCLFKCNPRFKEQLIDIKM